MKDEKWNKTSKFRIVTTLKNNTNTYFWFYVHGGMPGIVQGSNDRVMNKKGEEAKWDK